MDTKAQKVENLAEARARFGELVENLEEMRASL